MKATFKKALSLAMILMMVVSTMVILPLTASAAAPTALTDLGQGTAENPYVISTPEDLVFLGTIELKGQNGNKHIYMELANDIDMTGVTGFKSIKVQSGHIVDFDGKGFAIKNLTVTDGYGGFWVGGLFGLLRGGKASVKDADDNLLGDTIKNLTMENVNVSGANGGGNKLFGGIVGEASAPLTCDNCKVTGSVSGTGDYEADSFCVGGLLGYAHAPNYGEVIFNRCVNEATISSSFTKDNHAGGLVGLLVGMKNYTFSYCVNKGAVSCPVENITEGVVSVGGIVSYVSSLFGIGDQPAQVFENCVNLGDLSIANATKQNGMGGIIGAARQTGSPSTGTELKMTNCYDISKRTFACVFGSNGAMAGFPSSKDNFRTFENCYGVNAEGSTSPYTEICYVDLDASIEVTLTNSAIATSTTAAITLSDGRTSTVEAEIAMLESARLCGGHVYDNDCDATCNKGCGYTRPESMLHSYTDDCDATCDLGCGHERVAPHAYDNACDTDCNVCGATRTVADHEYYNDCDADCNICGATRTPKDHVYDDDKDQFCNSCGEKRELPKTPATTTAAPATTTPAPEAEKKGCGGAINSAYAVLALVGVLGFAFVAKKREEN